MHPQEHHHISSSDKVHKNIIRFAHKDSLDAATKNFLPDLKDHILGRLLGIGHSQSFSDDERDRLLINKNQLYQHGTLRVNYTTYDMRRDQDSINPKTHPDILMLASDSQSHPYIYARVIGIYHVDIIHAVMSPYL